MTTTELVGWAGTLTGIVLGLPQLVRLARTKNVEGLSLRAWQAMLAVNLGWTAHGIHIGQPPQIVASALSLVATVPILYLMSRQLHRSFVLTLVPGLILTAIMIAVDQLFGSAAYGVIAIIPAIISNAGQSVALIRAEHVLGVSVVFLMLAAVNQVFWLTWAILVQDQGTIIVAVTTGTIAVFNLGWYVARRVGLPALGHSAPNATF
ncbi:SemiSWEET family sugar transporter [Diaminobutyricibacter sp. McL0618]|uniref:SemiSWEET family sugar transporter n=1 Tax=Leifsonia sp. McL0618 TaxID=3415677 RepID=UPI003CEAFA3A